MAPLQVVAAVAVPATTLHPKEEYCNKHTTTTPPPAAPSLDDDDGSHKCRSITGRNSRGTDATSTTSTRTPTGSSRDDDDDDDDDNTVERGYWEDLWQRAKEEQNGSEESGDNDDHNIRLSELVVEDSTERAMLAQVVDDEE